MLTIEDYQQYANKFENLPLKVTKKHKYYKHYKGNNLHTVLQIFAVFDGVRTASLIYRHELAKSSYTRFTALLEELSTKNTHFTYHEYDHYAHLDDKDKPPGINPDMLLINTKLVPKKLIENLFTCKLSKKPEDIKQKTYTFGKILGYHCPIDSLSEETTFNINMNWYWTTPEKKNSETPYENSLFQFLCTEKLKKSINRKKLKEQRKQFEKLIIKLWNKKYDSVISLTITETLL